MSDKRLTPAQWAEWQRTPITDRLWAQTTPEFRREILDRLLDRETREIRPLPHDRRSGEFLEVAAWLREQIAIAFGGKAPRPDHVPTDNPPSAQASDGKD